jgi:uncharacterized protein (TIGR02147 family)
MSQSPFISVLEREYEERRRKNPSFSLRAFAQQLGVNVSTLSRLMRGKRGASPELIREIAERMSFDTSMVEQLLLAEAGTRSDPRAYEAELKTQSLEESRDMDGWEFLTIQALLETDLVISTHKEVADQLGIPVLRAKRCLDTLVKHQMVAFHEGRWKSTYKRVIAYRKGNPYVKRILESFADMSRGRLAEDDGSEDQSFSGMVMAVDPLKIPEAVRRIREFRNNLAKFLGTGRKSEVYRINIDLFPVGKKQRGR